MLRGSVRPLDILLVEDNPADAELMFASARRIQAASTMRRVQSGEEALELLNRKPPYADEKLPDLVLIDLDLPGMCGDEVLAKIRSSEDPAVRRVPVVMLTSSSLLEDVHRAYDIGANAFVTKPGDLDELIRLVEGLEAFSFNTARLPARAR